MRELSPLQYAVSPSLLQSITVPIRPNLLVGIMGKGVISGLFVFLSSSQQQYGAAGFWLFLTAWALDQHTYVFLRVLVFVLCFRGMGAAGVI